MDVILHAVVRVHSSAVGRFSRFLQFPAVSHSRFQAYRRAFRGAVAAAVGQAVQFEVPAIPFEQDASASLASVVAA